MKKQKKIKDPLSMGVAHPLKMIGNEDQLLATGTCFFYSYNDKLFLVTAKHNITGTHPQTSENRGIPIKIAVILYNIENGVYKGHCTHEIMLEENRCLEHPKIQDEVDVIAIPVDLTENEGLRPINKINFEDDLPIEVGMDVFILGYPHGYCSYPTVAPVWKRGSLATEFAINIGGDPKMYIDSATANGMSGAPVIAKLIGMWLPEGKKNDFNNYAFGSGRRFLGIYTGRYTDGITSDKESDIFNAQLGIVWKESVIEEIITGKINGLI